MPIYTWDNGNIDWLQRIEPHVRLHAKTDSFQTNWRDKIPAGAIWGHRPHDFWVMPLPHGSNGLGAYGLPPPPLRLLVQLMMMMILASSRHHYVTSAFNATSRNVIFLASCANHFWFPSFFICGCCRKQLRLLQRFRLKLRDRSTGNNCIKFVPLYRLT